MRLKICLLITIYTFFICRFDAYGEPSLIRFGVMSELTGPGAENGEQCRKGYKIAEDLFRSTYPRLASRIEVVYGDHKREQKAAISEFHRFEQLQVRAIAANHGLIGAAINPLSKNSRIPLFGVMGHRNFVESNPYAIRIIPTPQEEGGGLARQAIRDGVRKAAILLLEDDYIVSVGNAFESVFQELGGQIVYKDYFVETTSDFSGIATRIRSAKPDALAMTLGFQQFGPAIRRLREQQVNQPIYANYWLSYPSIIAAAGGSQNVEGSTYITERSDYPVFVSAYERLAPEGGFRSGVVYRCYSALAAALFSMGQCAHCDTRDEYTDFVTKLTELALPERTLHIVNREAKFQIEFYRFHDGTAVRVGQ